MEGRGRPPTRRLAPAVSLEEQQPRRRGGRVRGPRRGHWARRSLAQREGRQAAAPRTLR